MAVTVPTVTFVAPAKVFDVPQRKPTEMPAAVPRLVRSPLSVAAVVDTPDAAFVVTLGGVRAPANVLKLMVVPLAKPSPRAQASK